mgnify:CR=1 FL=1
MLFRSTLPDTDSDGISDSIDQCKTQPETINNFEDSDGCPDVIPPSDADNDGIADSYDKCPTQQETVNGFEDLDGCPDVAPIKDSDNDGLPDELDNCPKQAETVNGFEDTDGCPDTIPDREPSDAKDNSILQWTAIIASLITAAGGIAAAKYRKH